MAQRDNILQELNELQSSLASAEVQNAYRVPEGYFETLADQVLSRVKAMEADNAADELNDLSPLLAGISKKTPYSIPTGFFNGVDEKVNAIMNNDSMDLNPEEELKELSPLLSGLKKQMPYSVPAGYFENIDTTSAMAAQPAAKVVAMGRPKWFRYAAAAIVTGVIALAGFLIFSKQTGIDPNTKSYAWVEKSLKKVSTDDIDKFVESINEEAPVIAKTEVKENIQELNEINELMKDVPEKDLQNFLDETESLIDDSGSDEEVLLN